jgi:hypothetical protein
MPVIFYKSQDYNGGTLAGTNVSFVIKNSDGFPLYNSYAIYGNLTTDADGYISDPDFGSAYLQTRDLAGLNPGNYTATAYSTYFDQGAAAFVTNATNYTFEMLESAGVFADILVYPVWYPAENIVRFKMWTMNGIGNLTDPADMNLSVTTPGRNPFFSRTLSQMTRDSKGVYSYTFDLPINVTAGVYEVTLNARGPDGTLTSAFSAFRISTGGPYDVGINVIDVEVSPADYVDFELLLTNMGDATPDVLVEYWVSGANQTWDYKSESIQVNANANRTLLRNLYIVSGQPLGQYFVNAKVTYDQLHNLYATANSSFFVVQGGSVQPPAGGPGAPAAPGAGAVSPPGAPKIEITRYPQEIGMELDTVKYPIVEVKNSGGSTLYNVTLRMTGIPSPWIQEITPNKISVLPAGNVSQFTLTLKIPPTAETKEYMGKITADANVTSDEKSFSLTIFSTRAQLIRWEIDRLKKSLQDFEVDVENARKAGKDVKEVTPYIDQISEQINLAEDYLQKKMYDESLSAVQTGWSLLEKARYLLAQAPFQQILIETIFPPWLIALLVVLVIAIAILLFFVRRMKGVFDRVFRMQVPGGGGAAKSTVMVEKMKERESLEKEELNIRRVINLLDREFKEGLITENAFMDLKKRNEEKLAKIQERKTAMK